LAAATASFFFLSIYTSDIHALAPEPGTRNPQVIQLFYEMNHKREWEKTGRITFKDPSFIRSLNGGRDALALIVDNGNIIASTDIKGDAFKIMRAAIHEEIEAIMQIMAREDRSKYSSLINIILGAKVSRLTKHNKSQDLKNVWFEIFPTEDRNISDELLANHIIAKAFELMLTEEDRKLMNRPAEPSENEFLQIIRPVIDSLKHSYFTGLFFDNFIRESRIRIAIANGMRFYQAASPQPDAKLSAEAAPPKEVDEQKYLAPVNEQELVFDQILPSRIVNTDIEYVRAYQETTKIFKDILRAAGLNPELYSLCLLKDEQFDAFVFPYTARIYITTGLYKKLLDLPENSRASVLAFVLAHETVHILQERAKVDAGEKATLAGVALNQLLQDRIQRYTNEYQADWQALRIMDKAGYSAKYPILLFKDFLKIQESTGQQLWGNHPELPLRIFELRRAMRLNYWSSWAKTTLLSKAFSDEIKAQKDHSRCIKWLQAFNAKDLEERFKQMDDLVNMVDTAPDYEALLSVIVGVYHYGTNYFNDREEDQHNYVGVTHCISSDLFGHLGVI
jgi:Zn-dependent protease with chaperone function